VDDTTGASVSEARREARWPVRAGRASATRPPMLAAVVPPARSPRSACAARTRFDLGALAAELPEELDVLSGSATVSRRA